MEYIKLTPENLEHEHICRAISNKTDPEGNLIEIASFNEEER